MNFTLDFPQFYLSEFLSTTIVDFFVYAIITFQRWVMRVSTMEDFYDYLVYHGHQLDFEDFHIDDRSVDAVREVSKLIPKEVVEVPLSRIHHFRMKKDAKAFFQQNFRLHEVGYLTDNKLKRSLIHQEVSEERDISKIYNQSAKKISPFRLPLQYVYPLFYEASLVYQAIDMEDAALRRELLSEMDVSFKGIYLPKVLTPIATTAYVHEITHTQLESQKGIVEEYYNVEALSIFMELLYSYLNDPLIFQTELLLRLENVKATAHRMMAYDSSKEDKVSDCNFSEYSYHESAKYFISTFKALNMLQLYMGSDDNIRQYIIDCCQNVFDGKYSLEEMLKRLDITAYDSIHPRYVKSIFKMMP